MLPGSLAAVGSAKAVKICSATGPVLGCIEVTRQLAELACRCLGAALAARLVRSCCSESRAVSPRRCSVMAWKLRRQANQTSLRALVAASKRILVVEDSDLIRSTVAECLSEEGYAVFTAANGVEALAVVRYARPDAILLDLMMSVMDGWPFVAKCQEFPWCREIPIIVMSAAHALRLAAERLRELGVRSVISKPFDLEAVVAVIRRHAPLT